MLFSALQRASRQQRFWLFFRNLYYFVWMCSGFAFWTFYLIFGRKLIEPGAFMCMLIGLGWFSLALNNKGKINALVNRLTAVKEKLVLGPLCDFLNYDDREMRTLSKRLLIILLPTLQASDAPLLNAEQRTNLYRAMTVKDEPFTKTALKALEQIGDAKALPFVQKLARAEPKRPSQHNVVEAARACLPFLEERAEQERVSSTLLRAASSETNQDTLLRAASGNQTRTSELLRAGEDVVAPPNA